MSLFRSPTAVLLVVALVGTASFVLAGPVPPSQNLETLAAPLQRRRISPYDEAEMMDPRAYDPRGSPYDEAEMMDPRAYGPYDPYSQNDVIKEEVVEEESAVDVDYDQGYNGQDYADQSFDGAAEDYGGNGYPGQDYGPEENLDYSPYMEDPRFAGEADQGYGDMYGGAYGYPGEEAGYPGDAQYAQEQDAGYGYAQSDYPFPEEYGQEAYPQEYGQEAYSQDYDQEAYQEYGQEAYPQEYDQEAYPQDYGQEYPQDYGQEYPQDYGQEYPQDYGQEAYPQEYGQEAYPQEYGQEVYSEEYGQEVYPQEYGQEAYPQEEFYGSYATDERASADEGLPRGTRDPMFGGM